MLVDVRDPKHNSLLFRYDPANDEVQIAKRGEIHRVSLGKIKAASASLHAAECTISGAIDKAVYIK